MDVEPSSLELISPLINTVLKPDQTGRSDRFNWEHDTSLVW